MSEVINKITAGAIPKNNTVKKDVARTSDTAFADDLAAAAVVTSTEKSTIKSNPGANIDNTETNASGSDIKNDNITETPYCSSFIINPELLKVTVSDQAVTDNETIKTGVLLKTDINLAELMNSIGDNISHLTPFGQDATQAAIPGENNLAAENGNSILNKIKLFIEGLAANEKSSKMPDSIGLDKQSVLQLIGTDKLSVQQKSEPDVLQVLKKTGTDILQALNKSGLEAQSIPQKIGTSFQPVLINDGTDLATLANKISTVQVTSNLANAQKSVPDINQTASNLNSLPGIENADLKIFVNSSTNSSPAGKIIQPAITDPVKEVLTDNNIKAVKSDGEETKISDLLKKEQKSAANNQPGSENLANPENGKKGSSDTLLNKNTEKLKSEISMDNLSLNQVKSGNPTNSVPLKEITDFGTFSNVSPQEFIQKAEQMAKNITTGNSGIARMILKPDSLGTVFVEISINENLVKLNIKSDSKETARIIESQLPALREKMSLSGLQIESADISSRNDESSLLDNSTNGGNLSKENKNAKRDIQNSLKYLSELRDVSTEGQFEGNYALQKQILERLV